METQTTRNDHLTCIICHHPIKEHDYPCLVESAIGQEEWEEGYAHDYCVQFRGEEK